jgi:hypothetical protein
MRWFLLPIWWLAVLGVLVGYQTYLVIWPGPGGVRFVPTEAQLLLLGLLLSVPLAAGFSVTRGRRSGAEEGPDLDGRPRRSTLAGAIALPALILGFVVLDLLIETVLGDPPTNWGYLGCASTGCSFDHALPPYLGSIAVGAFLGWLGGIASRLVAVPRRPALTATSVLLLVALVASSAAPTTIGAVGPTAGSPTTRQVVEAFRRAGLEVGTPRPMTPDEFVQPSFPDMKLEAPVPIEGTRFSLPSFRQEVGGSVLRYSSTADAENAVGYWGWKSKQADSTADMLRIYARDDIVLLLAWDIPDGEAASYERALERPDIASLTPTAQEPAPSTTGKSPASASGDPGIAFGKPVVNTEHRVSNPVSNLLYLVGLRAEPPGGQVPASMSVLATNTTDQVKSFRVKATLKAGPFAVGTFPVEVGDLPPGQSRPVLLYSSEPIPPRYDSASVEVVEVLRESATTPGAEAARRLRFGTPSITTTSGRAEATVEITNEDPAPLSYTVRLTFLRGDEVLGVAMCRGDNFPPGKTVTATLRLVEGTTAGYDRLLLDADEAYDKSGGFCVPYEDSHEDPMGQGGKGK